MVFWNSRFRGTGSTRNTYYNSFETLLGHLYPRDVEVQRRYEITDKRWRHPQSWKRQAYKPDPNKSSVARSGSLHLSFASNTAPPSRSPSPVNPGLSGIITMILNYWPLTLIRDLLFMILQIQGRRAHAIQMIIAWLVLVPFGIFASRYYKETYSKVFFLQEYWWFSIHVLCMGAAAMFMYGGLYAMEIKRIEPLQWESPDIVVHSVLGFAAMGMFTIHILLGFFRFKKLEVRLIQIMMHWLFGNLEYFLARMFSWGCLLFYPPV